MKRNSSSAQFDDLPEECIAKILSFTITTPLEACSLAFVSKTFRSAADSDDIWDRFLPSDLDSVISRSSSSFSTSFSSKKHLFFSLFNNPIIIDNGKKSFSLDKRSGKKCYMISAGDLEMERKGDPEVWQWKIHPESRFKEVAELQLTTSLLIGGKIRTRMLSPETTYVSYLVFKLTENASGFHKYPAEAKIGPTEGHKTVKTPSSKTIFLAPDRWIHRFLFPSDIIVGGRELQYKESETPKWRDDGWLEVDLGEYFNNKGEYDYLRIYVRERMDRKYGLIVQGIEIRPKVG